MIISFGWTAQYLPPLGTKDTTRRIWAERTLRMWQKAWDEDRLVHDAVNKCLAYGGNYIGKVTLKERPYLEALADMPEEDVEREGGMVATTDEFVERYFGGDREKIVAVVRFDYQALTEESDSDASAKRDEVAPGQMSLL